MAYAASLLDEAGGSVMARTMTVAFLVAAVLLLAAPASAEHDPDGEGQYCVDSSTAHPDDPLITDTQTAGYCVVASSGSPTAVPDGVVAGRGDGGAAAIGGVGAIPTRIDAGAGGSAPVGNLVGIGGVITGAMSAVAALAVRHRRRS